MMNSRVNLPYLHDDLLLNCFARVSRLHYLTLSLVSKRFHSLVASLNLYKVRTLLGRTEKCLYMCLNLSDDSTILWFTLYRRQTPIPSLSLSPNCDFNSLCFTHCITSDNRLLSNFTVYPSAGWISATVGSNIYMIGGYIERRISSRVFYMDCRSHTWHEAPSIRMVLKYPHVSVLDEKIYVVSGASKLIECFDPKTQKWKHVPSPSVEIPVGFITRSLVFDGKLYLIWDENKTVVYKPKENVWDVVLSMETTLSYAPSYRTCVIGDVICEYDAISRRLEWYDSKEKSWRVLKGVDELPIHVVPRSNVIGLVRLENHGGKVAVLWEELEGTAKKKNIWCAEIVLERHKSREIYGKIEWCGVVLTVPNSSSLEILSVTV